MSAEPTFTIELTHKEGESLLQLLDVAVRAQGLNAALSAILFAQRIKNAADQLKATVPKED